MLWLLLVALPQVDIDGLEPGERVYAVAPAAREAPSLRDELAPAAPLVHGRVVDAFTGRPVAGATVETWTEYADAVLPFARVGAARSGVDGRFALPVRGAEKARVAAPGYATLSTTAGSLHAPVVLFPAHDVAPRVRFVDFDDRPIASVRVTTTYSCSHDAPAFDLRTGASGVAVLADFAFQDDIQELRVRAPGYAAIEYLDGEPALERGAAEPPYTVRLPRRRGARVRLLDEVGEPFAHELIHVHDGEGEHLERTDEDGLLTLEARYGDGGFVARHEGTWIGEIRPPRERLVTIRVGTHDWDEADEPVPVGRVRVLSDAEDDVQPLVWLFHEDGWSQETRANRDTPTDFPAGAGFAVVGGAFSGWSEQHVPFELPEGTELVLRPELEREPRVTVLAPEEHHRLWIQAGDDSTEAAAGEPVAVPPERPLVFLLERSGGELRRARVDTATDGLVVDLRGDETIVERDATPRPPRRVVVLVEGEAHDVEVRAHGLYRSMDVVEREPGRWELDAPAGSPLLVSVGSPRHATTWARARVAHPDDDQTIVRMRPVALASLAIHAPFPYRVVGGLDLARLHPGPLHLVLERDDGSRLGLELELEPGEQRRVRLR